MKYFIPAWYSTDNWWQDRARPYFDAIYSKSEFDDMVSLIGMHYSNDKKCKIIILNHFSDLRTFLYRNQLFEVPYWSVFDEIQGFQHATPRTIDFRNLQWPEGTEFVYTPYMVRCVTSAETYQNVYFSPIGYLVWIEEFINNTKTKRYVFDDRGMLSSIVFFDQHGEQISMQLISVHGDVILTENLKTKEVLIEEEYYKDFEQSSYHSMMDIIAEKLKTYVQSLNKNEQFIAAADDKHNHLINDTMNPHQLTYSIFTKRNREINTEILKDLKYANHWIVDTQDNENILKNEMPHHLLRITPFNTQVLTSISSQLYSTYIGFNIDGLSDERVLGVIELLVEFVKENSHMKIVLLTRSMPHEKQFVSEKIEEINTFFLEMEDDFQLFNEEEIDKSKVISIESMPFENDVIKTLAKLRILIDLNKEPDLFLQICSISAGIPQVNTRTTDYVEDNINGIIITKDSEITMALNYYLTVLKHWNKSLAYTMRLTEKYASINIIDKLERFIEGVVYEKEI